MLLCVAACAHPRDPIAIAFDQPPIAAGQTLELHERDGTTWRIHADPPTAEADYQQRPYALIRNGTRVFAVADSGAFQTNPDMMMSATWRFYIAADGTFRAASMQSTTTGRGSGATTKTVRGAFRWDGAKLVPADP